MFRTRLGRSRNACSFIFFFAAFAAFAPCSLAGRDPFTPLQQRIESLREEREIPGASIAVIKGGRIAWARGFGMADQERARPVTKDTLFQAQSITKVLTSLATVKLLASRQIALDEPVNRYLKQWTIPENKYTAKVPVTFRMLLNHTGALSNPYPDGCCGPSEPLPNVLQVLNGLPPATNDPVVVERVPGSEFDYCNGCYTVLQLVLESISQQSFPALMQQLVFSAAGMKQSTFDNTFFLKDNRLIAIPYDVDDRPHRRAPMRHSILSTGLMWTTASDLARFSLSFTKALRDGSPLVDQSLAEEFIIPSSAANRSLGFFLSNRDANTQDAGRYLFHSGSGNGALSLSIVSIDGMNGAVILINKAPNPWLTTDIPQYGFIIDALKLISSEYSWSDG